MSELYRAVHDGLECCVRDECSGIDGSAFCPYHGVECIDGLLRDAFILIQQQREKIAELETAQKPRLLTLDEIIKHDGPVYITWQDPESGCWAVCPPKEDIYRFREWDTLSFPGGPVNQLKMKYGKTWRCWTQRPTDEQRKAMKWDE